MFLGVGAADKTYIDDVFDVVARTSDGSTYVNSSGLDLSGEGGMVWTKSRSKTDGGAAAFSHIIHDSIRGASYSLSTDNNNQSNTGWAGANTLTSTGYSIAGGDATNNATGYRYADWAFRKSSGFFDVVSYTGTGSARTIAHSLGSIPGMIWVKKTSGSEDWTVYHREIEETKWLYLNTTDGVQGPGANPWNGTRPTASVFSLGTHNLVNENSATYIAYVFAGGESTAATARSVDFDGNDYLSIPVNNSDFDWAADGSLTIEAFVNMDAITGQTYNSIINRWGGSGTYSFGLDVKSNGNLFFYRGNGSSISTHESSGVTINIGQWYHIAVVKDGTTGRFFINGQSCGTFSWNEAFTNSTSIPLHLGNLSDGNSYPIDGRISNARFVNGQALYTTSFRPSTEPLTTTSQSATASNVKLLCCNNSSTTGSTVTPGTITANGDPTASIDSPFDDPAGFVFGANEDQNVIKCGSYTGNGSATGPEINLGFEPQWVLIKNFTSGSGSPWALWDNIRGLVTDGNDAQLYPNQTQEEYNGANRVDLTPTGFQLRQDNHMINSNGSTYMYVCVRMSDGYVGKPPDAGTDVFTIDLAGINAGDPSWISNFPVDMQFIKDRNGTTYNNFLSTRLTQGEYLPIPTAQAAIDNAVYKHDYMNGWGNYSSSDAEIITSWMWKRHTGFDVVTYIGTGSNMSKNHSLNAVPQMIWVKNRDQADIWTAGHFGTNGGSSPWNYRLRLNSYTAQESQSDAWNQTAPTSTHFTVGTHESVNTSGENYIAFLFTSVSGISKCGYYDGSNSDQTITVGFQPRFIIIRRTDDGDDWIVLDTFRGWGSGNDERLRLNETNAEDSDTNWGAPTSTGFTVTGGNGGASTSGGKYVYYAHA